MATIAVTYPSGPEFDMDYYLTKHMPMIAQEWSKFGLKSYEILQFGPGQPYQTQALMRWDALESFSNAPNKEKIFADVKNYTTAEPILSLGESSKSEVMV